MKNSILAILAVATLASCKKNETTVIDNTTDSTMIVPSTDSSMMSADSTAMSGTAAMLTDQDKTFVDAAAKGGMMEVMMGEAAEMNGMNEKVKALGKMIKEDHMKANNELKAWASNSKYMLPTQLDADQQKMVDDLKMKKGAEFDKAYTDMMMNDHNKDIAAFKKEATDGTGDVKAFAAKTIPTLEGHLAASEKVMMDLK